MRRFGRAAIAMVLGLAFLPAPVLLAQTAAPPPEEGVRLTLPQAQAAMRNAAAAGNARAVMLLGRSLVQGGAADGQVHYLLSQAELTLNQPDPALRNAALAYQMARTKPVLELSDIYIYIGNACRKAP